MRLPRAALTLALAVLPVAIATPAHALSCPLVTDPAGDARLLGLTLPVRELDIVSADVASGPATVAVALRVVSLDHTYLNAGEPTWRVQWVIGDKQYAADLWFGYGPLGRGYVPEFRINGHSVGPVPFTVDVVTDTITWTIPRGLLPDLATPGATFTGIQAITWRPGLGYPADQTTPPATYVDQDPGCIPAS